MSKRKAPYSILPPLLIIFLFLCSCSHSDYSDSESCSSLAEAVKNTWGDELEFAEYGEDYLEYLFDDDPYHDDFSMLYSVRTENIDELGIFHAPDAGSAKELFEEAREYIEDMKEDQRAFIASYAPEELPKLDRASVKIFGNYVVYVIASPERIDSALSAIEEKLK